MRITMVRSEGLSALSYFISSEGEALVIDPRRDAEVYRDLALAARSDIRYILETHRNEDFVTGSLELQNIVPAARICHSSETRFMFGEERVTDGSVFTMGGLRIECLSTPGHTDDSVCYAVTESPRGKHPVALFTGDTLFVNEVGRTDLVDPKITGKMADKLYSSLHDKILTLPDGVVVYPGHGAGSVCGGDIADREVTTIGYERAHNKWLTMDRAEFVERKEKQNLTRASYFKHCEKVNTEGPPLIYELKPPVVYDSDTLERMSRDPDAIVIDTRSSDSFSCRHIPGSLSVPLKGMGLTAGWVLEPSERIFLVLENWTDLVAARIYLLRLGLDRVEGFLGSGIEDWASRGRRTESITQYSLPELRKMLDSGAIQLVDVRQEHETETEYIDGTLMMPLTSVHSGYSGIDRSRPIATICPSGVRSTTAASILKRSGFDNVGVARAGMKAWKRLGYPVVTKTGVQ